MAAIVEKPVDLTRLFEITNRVPQIVERQNLAEVCQNGDVQAGILAKGAYLLGDRR